MTYNSWLSTGVVNLLGVLWIGDLMITPGFAYQYAPLYTFLSKVSTLPATDVITIKESSK
jgi:hypothetical protein